MNVPVSEQQEEEHVETNKASKQNKMVLTCNIDRQHICLNGDAVQHNNHSKQRCTSAPDIFEDLEIGDWLIIIES